MTMSHLALVSPLTAGRGIVFLYGGTPLLRELERKGVDREKQVKGAKNMLNA